MVFTRHGYAKNLWKLKSLLEDASIWQIILTSTDILRFICDEELLRVKDIVWRTNLQKNSWKLNSHLSIWHFSDDSTFKDILRFICDEELLRVKAIVWNILPNVRKDALLTKQARLINLFKPKDIWHNVVIVCKQSRNPEDDAQVDVISSTVQVKFIYSEKATKFCEIFPLLLTAVHTVKSKGKILQNFVAFSEYMNSKRPVLSFFQILEA